MTKHKTWNHYSTIMEFINILHRYTPPQVFVKLLGLGADLIILDSKIEIEMLLTYYLLSVFDGALHCTTIYFVFLLPVDDSSCPPPP